MPIDLSFLKGTIDKGGTPCLDWKSDAAPKQAGVAQAVEQLTCNEQVGGSSPSASSSCEICFVLGHQARKIGL